MTALVREAVEGDAGGIALIYNDAVLHTTAIWNDSPVSDADRVVWMRARQDAGFPVLVADDGGKVVGYASYGTWRAIDGFRHTVEHSVYVRDDHRGRGLGRTLLAALIERARQAGIHVMVGAIESGNTGSLRLHAALGFTQVGALPQVGEKFGRWLDLTFVQLMVDDRPIP